MRRKEAAAMAWPRPRALSVNVSNFKFVKLKTPMQGVKRVVYYKTKYHFGLIISFHLVNLLLTPGGYSGIFRIGALRRVYKASTK